MAEFNGKQDELGALVRVVEGDGGLNQIQWTIAYKLSTATKIESSAPAMWKLALHVPLTIDVDWHDPGSGESIESLRTRVAAVIQSGTNLFFSAAHLQTLPDPLRAVNDDQRAIDVLRLATKQERYFVVSAVAIGNSNLTLDDAWLFGDSYKRPYVGNSTFELGGVYFHVNYSCPKFDFYEELAPTKLPKLYLYTPVRYDYRAKRAQLDQRAIDPNFFTISHSPT